MEKLCPGWPSPLSASVPFSFFNWCASQACMPPQLSQKTRWWHHDYHSASERPEGLRGLVEPCGVSGSGQAFLTKGAEWGRGKGERYTWICHRGKSHCRQTLPRSTWGWAGNEGGGWTVSSLQLSQVLLWEHLASAFHDLCTLWNTCGGEERDDLWLCSHFLAKSTGPTWSFTHLDDCLKCYIWSEFGEVPSLKIKKKSHWKVSHQRQDTYNSGGQWGHPYCKMLFSQSQEMGPPRQGLLRWLEVGEHIWALELYYLRVLGRWAEPGTSAVRFLSLHWGLLSAASHSTVSFHNSFLWFDLFLDPGILWTQFFVQDCFPLLLGKMRSF